MTVRRVETVGLREEERERAAWRNPRREMYGGERGEKKNETDFEDFCYSAPAVNIIRSRKPT